jgi:hypothetical protein
MKRSAHLMLVSVLLLVGFSFATNASTACQANTSSHLIGPSCTAEVVSMPTSWAMNESLAVLPTHKLILMATALLLLATTFTTQHQRSSGLTWFNLRVNLARTGPAPNGMFLPYLFATHGW